jgi:peptidoglycan/LPS O-acetylase OafA/YrhL
VKARETAIIGVALTVPGKAIVGSRPSPARERTGYLPTLDGWRAVAILAVVGYHESLSVLRPLGAGWLYEHGKNGVDLFFAISGFLICSRLLEEERTFGAISLRNFYIRRALRILPPALLYLAVIGILIFTGVLHIGLREWLSCVFFFRNYTSLLGKMGPDLYFTGHFWSLAVEEHFYLILPALLVLTRKGWRLPTLLGLVLILEFYRMQVLGERDWQEVSFHSGICLDELLIPAVFAVLVQSSDIRQRMAKWLRFWPVLVIAVVYLVSDWEGRFWRTTLVSVLMPLILLGSVWNAHGYLAMCLEWAPIRYLGRISYGLYLWQELFITGHRYVGYPLGILERTPLRFAATLAVAMASYHLLERPLIKLGHKLAPPATPGREDVPCEDPNIKTTAQSAAPQI